MKMRKERISGKYGEYIGKKLDECIDGERMSVYCK